MPRAWTPSFVIIALAAAGISVGPDGGDRTSLVPNLPDLTIKTRETIDRPHSTIQTATRYFKGAWQRTDLDLDVPSASPAQRTMQHSTISRCDEGRTLFLNHEARLYGWSPLNVVGRDVSYGVRSWFRPQSKPPAAGAEVTITINTVDTGERRQMGSFSARHIIITTTTDPSPGANTRRSESVQDGWHIDLPTAGCQVAGDGQAFLTASTSARLGSVPDRLSVDIRGAGQRGFAVEETTQHRGEHEPLFTTRVTLIEWSEAPLENSLFDVPVGYRPAVPRLVGGFDITKPDSAANRLAAYWQDAMILVGGFFRF